MKFVHIPKPRQFNFKPRYYDPKKEELQQRIARAEGKYVPGANLQFRKIRSRRKPGDWTASMIRLAIMFALAGAMYYFAKSKGLI